MVKMQNKPVLTHKKGRAIRLTFTYEGDKIHLTDRREVDKPTQPSAPLLKRNKEDKLQSGFWVELHDTRRQALYRMVMSNPISFHAEVSDGKGGFTNLPRPKPSGVFFVVVPNLPEVKSIVLFSSPLGFETKIGPAEPIARFTLQSGKEEKL
jgi:hypothetical protein